MKYVFKPDWTLATAARLRKPDCASSSMRKSAQIHTKPRGGEKKEKQKHNELRREKEKGKENDKKKKRRHVKREGHREQERYGERERKREINKTIMLAESGLAYVCRSCSDMLLPPLMSGPCSHPLPFWNTRFQRSVSNRFQPQFSAQVQIINSNHVDTRMHGSNPLGFVWS